MPVSQGKKNRWYTFIDTEKKDPNEKVIFLKNVNFHVFFLSISEPENPENDTNFVI